MEKKKENKRCGIAKSFGTFWRHLLSDPYLDWTVFVIIFTIVMIVLVLVGYLSYTGFLMRKDPQTKVGAVEKQSVLDEKTLDKVLNVYDERAKEREKFQEGYVGLEDPAD